MNFFNHLDYSEFNNAITSFLKKHKKFQQVENLKAYDGISGYYMMILDEYKLVYIGKSDNIKNGFNNIDRLQNHLIVLYFQCMQ